MAKKAKDTQEEARTEKPNENDDDNDNDSEEDGDYNPEEEEAKEKDDENDADEPMEVVVDETNFLAPAQKRAVDEAFQELFGYAWGTSFQLPRRKDQKTAKERMLVQILGPIRAARILKAGGTLRPRRSVARRQAAQLSQGPTTTGNNSSTTVTPSFSQQKQEPQYETKMFAGKAIQVPKTAAGNKKAPPKAAASSGGGINSVLRQIEGPSKISTVAKTSSDWDTFKTETGLEAELEKKAQGKDAYLIKQDFLTRVDTRKFELEKGERDKERAKRGK